MLTSALLAAALAVKSVTGQSTSGGAIIISGTNSATGSISAGGDAIPTAGVTYLSYASTITSSIPYSFTSSRSGSAASTAANATTTGSQTNTRSTSTTGSLAVIVGGGGATSTRNGTNGTASSTTSSAAQATNTQPCNGYPELCGKKYGNITQVCAHNSPFARANNAASNQDYGVTQQLNDGIRMLQGQTHRVNNTMYYCHTSCDLLNAGTVEEYLRNVTTWVEAHPFDVVTVLIGNGDYENTYIDSFIAPIQNSGIVPYLYVPPKIPMALDDWPTLSTFILTQKRVVLFMDYNANQTAFPYVLDEFSQMWETPFSPTNDSFPCTVERPPGLPSDRARNDLLYMANHNLNADISIGSINLLVPNTVAMNQTNGLTGEGSLGLTANNCASDWGRPPNFLLVDYYNRGSFPGSVFQVAANMNNVTYNNASCCGTSGTSAATSMRPRNWIAVVAVTVVLSALLL